jgi:hypothetical protein
MGGGYVQILAELSIEPLLRFFWGTSYVVAPSS